MQDKPTDILDHLIFVIEPGKLSDGVARFEKMGFKLRLIACLTIPGGLYTGGLAENALIILADGIYIELLSYTHDISHYPAGSPEREARENHPWANSPPGWADWTHLDLASDPSNTYKVLNERATSEVFLPPIHTGRVKPDGVELKMTVTFREKEQGVGRIPYFCQDLTPRRIRVPTYLPSNTAHPNAAKGIASIKVISRTATFQRQRDILSAIIGSAPANVTSSTAVWSLAGPNSKSTSPTLLLVVEDEGIVGTEGGISDVSLWFELGGNGLREEVLQVDG